MVEFGREHALVNIFLVILSSTAIIKVLDVLIEKDYSVTDRYGFGNQQLFHSSIWCWGNDHNNRRCRMTNVCYSSNHRQWIFIKGLQSIESGLPDDPFKPALASISSLTNHNQFYFNYITISANYFANFSAGQLLRLVKSKTFIYGRFKPDNLMHSLHDDILPLKWTLDGLGWNQQFNLFMHDDWHNISAIPFNQYLYTKLFNYKEIFIKTMEPNRLVCFQEASLGLDRETTWYQYGFHSPQGPLEKAINQQINIQKVSEQLRTIFKTKPCSTLPYGVLISRTHNRLILNEDELIDYLSKNVIPIKRVSLDDKADDGLIKTIETIICASLLISIHGSAMSLSIFLPKGSHVVELFPYGINPDHYTPYKTLASYRGLNYQQWVNQNLDNSIQHPEYPSILGGIANLSAKEKHQIKPLSEALEPHLCCADPNWLYRIYQDTRVDIQHFSETINLDQVNKTLNHQTSSDLFYPGPVLNIQCNYEELSSSFRIEWNNPWNLGFSAHDGQVSFEILIDDGGGKGYAMFTSTNFLAIPKNDQENFSFWVRCLINGRKGPFKLAYCSRN